MPPDNGWNAWRELMLKRHDDQDDAIDKMQKTLDGVVVQVAKLRVKAGLWGATAAMLPVLAAALWVALK